MTTLTTEFGTFDIDNLSENERRALAEKVRSKLTTLKQAKLKVYLAQLAQLKREAEAEGLFDSDDSECNGYLCLSCAFPLLLAADENTPSFGIKEEKMPTVDPAVIARLIQDKTGRKFKKDIDVTVIRDAAYIPSENKIIIDAVLNNDREQFHKAEIHELLHKLSTENNLNWTHNEIFPLQDAIYAELQARHFPPPMASAMISLS